MAAAIDQAAEAIVITDLDGSILYVNPAFTRVTGYGSREAIGQNPRVLKSGTQNPAYYRNLWETIRGGVTWKGALINRRKDGTTYTEEMTITPVRDSCGDIVRFIALKQDVSDRRAAEESVAADEKSPPGGMSPLPGPVRALGATQILTRRQQRSRASRGTTNAFYIVRDVNTLFLNSKSRRGWHFSAPRASFGLPS